MELTALEQCILSEFVRKYPDVIPADFGASCTVTERDRTSSGFFTTFAIKPPETAPNEDKQGDKGDCDFLNELKMTAANLTEGADVLLHRKNGQVDYLEVYSFDKGHPLESVDYGFEDMSPNYIDF